MTERERPCVRTIRPGHGAGPDWFYVSARYASAKMARDTWERVERRLPRGELGIYRHGPRAEPGVLVSAVSLNREQIDKAARLLRDGVDEPLPYELAEMLVIRRARVVVEAGASGDLRPRRIKIRHAGEGATLTPEGEMIEPGQGEG